VVFDQVLESGGLVRGIRVPGGASLSRKQLGAVEQAAKDAGAGGAAWCKITEDGPTGPLARFLEGENGSNFIAALLNASLAAGNLSGFTQTVIIACPSLTLAAVPIGFPNANLILFFLWVNARDIYHIFSDLVWML
jgi:hypothetical protein